MRDNMLVNVSGLPGHFMAVDLNIEHLIGYLKVQNSLFLAHRLNRLVLHSFSLLRKASEQVGTSWATSLVLYFSYSTLKSK